MTEVEKMQRAKMYIDKLANGINPITDEPAAETDVINNIRVSRCLFYVSEILRNTIESLNTPIQNKKNSSKSKKEIFNIPYEDLGKFCYSDTPLYVSQVADQINKIIDLNLYHKIDPKDISKWLIEIGMLDMYAQPSGKPQKEPTPEGESIGIIKELYQGPNRDRILILYTRSAQEFIINNIDSLAQYIKQKHCTSEKEDSTELSKKGTRWTEEDVEQLTAMFKNGVSVAEIATTLRRNEGGIRSRLEKLGLIDDYRDAP